VSRLKGEDKKTFSNDNFEHFLKILVDALFELDNCGTQFDDNGSDVCTYFFSKLSHVIGE
jgi:hypothetical protein